MTLINRLNCAFVFLKSKKKHACETRCLWKKCGALTWSSQSQRGVACVSMQTPAWPAGRAGLWGEGWGQVDRPQARGGCWLPIRTAEGRQVCRALQMNQRRYLQEKQKVKDWVDDTNIVEIQESPHVPAPPFSGNIFYKLWLLYGAFSI